jgi:TrmH family RNA methyltransferase
VTELLTARSGRIKAARRLADRRVRRELGLFLVEGPQLVAEAGAVPGAVVEVYATPDAAERYADLRDRSPVAWQLTDDRGVASLADTVTPTGVVAVCRADSVLAPLESAVTPGARLVVVCADVRDPGNAGTVIRSADAAGADAVVLAGHSVDPLNPKTVRATVGSLFHLPVVVADDVAGAVTALRAAGVTVLAADGGGEVDLFDADELLGRRTAWLFGNEAWGLPVETAALADHRVRVPIFGGAESLNLSTAAAVCLYASARAHRGS